MVLYEGLKMYNALPMVIKNKEKIQNYRKKLAQFIIKKERGVNVKIQNRNRSSVDDSIRIIVLYCIMYIYFLCTM